MMPFPSTERNLGADSSGSPPKFKLFCGRGRYYDKFFQGPRPARSLHHLQLEAQHRIFNLERGEYLRSYPNTTMPSSPTSTLSILSSEDFADEFGQISDDDDLREEPLAMPPAKRQRTGPASELRASTSQFNLTSEHEEPREEESDISSDTSGDVPNSPINGMHQTQEDDPTLQEQVTICRWEDCAAGDLGDMDRLVAHIHDIHVGTRQKRYACEWMGCNRKGQLHASGYALKAHMRSHTREKPFYCLLPECDRSFTRSDALAKHMRTVHETEALRPSDPVSKNHNNAPAKLQRIKLTLSARPPNEEQRNGEEENIDDDATVPSSPDATVDESPLSDFEPPSDVEFTEEELAMPVDHLARLLRRQIHWGEQEGEELKAEIDQLEAQRKSEWQAKELLLENLMEAEGGRAREKRQKTGDGGEYNAKVLPLMNGFTPWYRKPKEEVSV